MFFAKTFVASATLAASVSAHMVMNNPKPLGASSLNNSPLAADGSDFPCKQRSGVYDGEPNVYALGSQQNLSFTGSAVHGGGSCQVSITYDKAPTKDSVWKVIHSIQGGCPARNTAGNLAENANGVDPDSYAYTIPDNIPSGDAVIAWTWHNKVGNREMYMNCGGLTLTGTGGDQSNYDALPDMFKANIGNGCTTADSKDVKYPDPGQSVDNANGGSDLAAPVGSCGSTGGSTGGATGGASSTAKATSAASTAAPSATSKAASTPGGVFVTASAGASSAAPTSAVATSAATSAAAAPSATSGSGAGSGSSAGALTGSCTEEGTWNCIGGSSFQQCASGTWSAPQKMASGTTCTPGQSASMAIAGAKRQIRAFRA